jgi:hypothetical protein
VHIPIEGATYGISNLRAEQDPAPTTRFDWFKEEAL